MKILEPSQEKGLSFWGRWWEVIAWQGVSSGSGVAQWENVLGERSGVGRVIKGPTRGMRIKSQRDIVGPNEMYTR